MDEMENASMVEEIQERQPITTRSRLNLVLCIVLAINSLLQSIAIFTPGWDTLISEDVEIYVSVYYRTVCFILSGNTTTCESKTFRAQFSDLYDIQSDGRRAELVLDNSLRVRYQMNAQLSWIIIVATTVYQAFLYFRSTKLFPRLTALNAMILMAACCFMYQVVYEAFSHIDYTRRLMSASEEGGVGFPYSLFLYSIAFVQTCACTFLVAKQTLDYIRSLLHSSAEIKDKYDTFRTKYAAEIEASRYHQHSQSDNTRSVPYNKSARHSQRQSTRQSPRPSPESPPRQSTRQSPKPSPESHPRQAENRAHSRYMELLERSRHAHDEHVDHSASAEHFDTPHDISAIHFDQK